MDYTHVHLLLPIGILLLNDVHHVQFHDVNCVNLDAIQDAHSYHWKQNVVSLQIFD